MSPLQFSAPFTFQRSKRYAKPKPPPMKKRYVASTEALLRPSQVSKSQYTPTTTTAAA